MDELFLQVVRRLWRDAEVPLSRNKYFEVFEDPMVQRARRVARHLQSLCETMTAYGPGAVESVTWGAQGVTVGLKGPHWRRRSFLDKAQWRMCCEDARVKQVFQAHLGDAFGELEAFCALDPAPCAVVSSGAT